MTGRVIGVAFGVVLLASALTGCSAGGLPGGSSSGSSGGSAATTELNACTLMTAARATSLAGRSYSYSSATAATIAVGQDQCTYNATNNDSSLVVIVYQSNSGVTFDQLKQVEAQTGSTKPISGLGDEAIIGSIELDVKLGQRLIAIQGAGGLLTNDTAHPIAVAKAVISALR